MPPVMARIWVWLALAGCLFGWPATAAWATPMDELAKARLALRTGDCNTAVPLLAALLYPQARLANSKDLVEAHLLLGACHVEQQHSDAASREFEQALFLDADATLDPHVFTAGAVAVFERTRQAQKLRSEREASARALAEEQQRLQKFRDSLIFYEVRPYYINFVPFGAGQFQNQHNRKGLWFAGSQLATGATSAAIWLYLVGEYGFGGRVPPEDSRRVRTLQQIEIGTGAACLGLMAWGIVDALLYYKPKAQVRGDDTLLPPPPRTTSLAVPVILPGQGGGLMLQGTF